MDINDIALEVVWKFDTEDSFLSETSLIRAYLDPIFFIQNYCMIEVSWQWLKPFALFEYQKEAILSYQKYRFNIILKGRQLWFTTLISAYALWVTLQPWNSVLILSKWQTYSMDVLRKIKIMYNNLPKELRISLLTENTEELEFINKNRIKSLPANERSWAGLTASMVILDEFSGFQGSSGEIIWEDIYSSIFPTLSTNPRSKMIVQGTPRGMGNKYAQIWHSSGSLFNKIKAHWTQHPEFSKWIIPIDENRKNKWWGDYTSPWAEEIMASDIGKDWWNQEYNLDFLQSWRPVFNQGEIIKIILLDRNKEPDSTHKYVCWVDLASWGAGDYSVAQIINTTTKQQIITYRTKQPLDIFWVNVVDLCYKFNTAKLAFENNSGYGIAFMKYIQDYPNLYYQTKMDKNGREIASKLGFTTTRSSKEKMMTDLSIAMR